MGFRRMVVAFVANGFCPLWAWLRCLSRLPAASKRPRLTHRSTAPARDKTFMALASLAFARVAELCVRVHNDTSEDQI